MLRKAERSIATLGTESDRRQAALALGLLVAELVDRAAGARGRWASPQGRAAGNPVPPLRSGFAAEAVRTGDPQADLGVLALWRACLALSPAERADAARLPVPALAADLIWTAPRREGESRHRLLLVGPDAAGKTCLIEHSGLGFRRVGWTPSGENRCWRAGAVEAIEATPPVAVSPGETAAAVLPVDRPTGGALPAAADFYLVLTGIDRLAGFDAFFADLAESERQGPCGVQVAPGDSAAPHFAAALAQRLLRRLAAEPDRDRRADLLTFAARLAEACEQAAEGEPEAVGRPPIRGIFITACPAPAGETPGGAGQSWFVRGLFEDVLLPGAAAAAARRRRWPGARPTLLLVVLLAGLLGALWRWSMPTSGPPSAPGDERHRAGTPPGLPPAADRQAAPLPAAPIYGPASGPFSFPGTPAAAYEQVVRPACQAAIQDLYPFFGSSADDASAAEMRRMFGPRGLLPSFFEAKVRPLITTDGPVWRWRRGAGTKGFDPATPQLFAKLPALAALTGEGLEITIEAVGFGGGVTGARLELPGAAYDFERAGRAHTLRWRLSDRAADSTLVLLKGDRQVRRYQEGGIWSLFRLIDKGDGGSEADGATLVAFSDGEHVARFRLRAADGIRPFERGETWSFRCPSGL